MGKHEAPEPKPSHRRRLIIHIWHSGLDVLSLFALHIVALGKIEHGPVLVAESRLLPTGLLQ